MIQTVIKIANRVDHIVDFERPNDKRTYILENNENTSQELFSFYVEANDDSHANYVPMQDYSRPATWDDAWINVIPVITSRSVVEENDSLIKVFLTIEFRSQQNTSHGKNKPNCINHDCIEIESGEDIIEGVCNVNVSRSTLNRNTIDKLWIYLTRNSDNPSKLCTEVNVEFKYTDINGTKRKSEVVIFVSPKSDIYDVVLDFGSEASQILMCRRSEDQSPNNIINTFDSIYHQLTGKEIKDENERQKYEQYDQSLYRSIYYAKYRNLPQLKESASVPMLFDAVGEADPEVQDVLKMLTTEQEASNLLKGEATPQYLRMPNLKLASFQAIPQPKVGIETISNFKNQYFYRRAINTFILTALLQLPSEVKAVNLYVLMPNVYDYSKVTANLRNIREDVNAMLVSAAYHQSLEHIKAMQIETVSESDASLLGASVGYTKFSTFPPGRYLVVDAGKGTLDYSVMQVEPGAKYEHLYKGGIIGAGSALTTGYLMALLHDFARNCNVPEDKITDANIIKLLYQKILGTPTSRRVEDLVNSAMLGRLLKYVDRYKCTVNATGATAMPQPFHLEDNIQYELDDITIDSFVDYVERQSDDSYTQYVPLSASAQRYIDKIIETMCLDVVNDLSVYRDLQGTDGNGQRPIKKVIFAGRAFKHLGLKRRMMDLLKYYKYIDGDECEVAGPNIGNDQFDVFNKNICLFPSHVIRNGNYISRSASAIEISEADESKPSTTKKGGVGGWFKGLIFGAPSASEEASNPVSAIVRCFSSAGGGNDTDAARADMSILAKGITLEKVARRKSLVVAGSNYTIPSEIGPNECRLFFTSNKVILVDNNGASYDIERTRVQIETSALTMASMFPYLYTVTFNQFRDSMLNLLAVDIVDVNSDVEAQVAPASQPITQPNPHLRGAQSVTDTSDDTDRPSRRSEYEDEI